MTSGIDRRRVTAAALPDGRSERGSLILMLTIAAGCLTMLNGALLVVADSNPPWWQVAPVWLGALGTSLAFLITYRLFRQGSRERQREQASQVYAWLEEGATTGGAPPTIELVVKNGSRLPVYSVDVFPRVDGEAIDADAMPEGGTLLPGSTKRVPWTPDQKQYAARNEHPLLRFRDAAGHAWARVGDDLHLR
jgi:hypothetical protein